jgi:hypothetical protein
MQLHTNNDPNAGDGANMWTSLTSVEEPAGSTTPTSGQWTVSYRTYYPSSNSNGWMDASITSAYGVDMYQHQGLYLRYGTHLGTPSVSLNVPWGSRNGEGLVVPLVPDQWIETKLEIDLDADTLRATYNGSLLYADGDPNAHWFNAGSPEGIGGALFWCTGGRHSPPDEWFVDDLTIRAGWGDAEPEVVVPEPATLALVGLGAIGLLIRRR